MKFYKKLNKKYFNWAAWITVILTFILPYQSTDGFAFEFGYPFTFLTVYNNKPTKTLVMSSATNILVLLLDMLIVYYIIYFACRLRDKLKEKEK